MRGDLWRSACVWFTSSSNSQFSHLRDVSTADSPLNSTAYAVEVDGNGPPGSVECDGCALGIVPNGTGFTGTSGRCSRQRPLRRGFQFDDQPHAPESIRIHEVGNQVGMPARVIGREDMAQPGRADGGSLRESCFAASGGVGDSGGGERHHYRRKIVRSRRRQQRGPRYFQFRGGDGLLRGPESNVSRWETS